MTGKVLPCHMISDAVSKLEVVVAGLNIVGASFTTIVGIARKVLVEVFGEPVAEGAQYIDKNRSILAGYRMIYRCRDGEKQKYIVAELWDDTDCGATMHYFTVEESSISSYIAELYPEKIDLKLSIEPIKSARSDVQKAQD